MAAVDMVTTAEVRTRLEIEGTKRDPLIASTVTAASRAINAHCHRELTPRTAAATRRIEVRGFLVNLSPYDLRTATTVTLDPDGSPTVLAVHTDYEPTPMGADPYTSTYTEILISRFVSLQTNKMQSFGRADISIAGAWGAWDTVDVPAEVRNACMVTVGSWIDKAVSAYGETIEDGRSIMPSFFQSLAIPKAAWSLLQDLGLPRFNAV